MRSADDVVRDASKALRETKSGAATAVDWQLAWDLMRAGRQETAREIFYQRAAKHPGASELWEQWARFELLQGDAERARGLYRAALLNAEGLDPRRRAETLRKWGVMESARGRARRRGPVRARARRPGGGGAARGRGRGDEEKKGGGEDDARDESLASASASVSSLRAARCVVLHAYAQTRAKTGDPARARGGCSGGRRRRTLPTRACLTSGAPRRERARFRLGARDAGGARGVPERRAPRAQQSPARERRVRRARGGARIFETRSPRRRKTTGSGTRGR